MGSLESGFFASEGSEKRLFKGMLTSMCRNNGLGLA